LGKGGREKKIGKRGEGTTERWTGTWEKFSGKKWLGGVTHPKLMFKNRSGGGGKTGKEKQKFDPTERRKGSGKPEKMKIRGCGKKKRNKQEEANFH